MASAASTSALNAIVSTIIFLCGRDALSIYNKCKPSTSSMCLNGSRVSKLVNPPAAGIYVGICGRIHISLHNCYSRRARQIIEGAKSRAPSRGILQMPLSIHSPRHQLCATCRRSRRAFDVESGCLYATQ